MGGGSGAIADNPVVKGQVKTITQKNSKDGFLRGVAEIPVVGGTTELKGEIKGDFIITRVDLYGGFYRTTHIPTGYDIAGNVNANLHKMTRTRQKQFVDNLINNKVSFPNSQTEIGNLTRDQALKLQKQVEDSYN